MPTNVDEHDEALGHLELLESEYDPPATGYILILASSVSGSVKVCDSKGEVGNATVATGDGLPSGGEVPEGPNAGVESGMNPTATANDN